ncbi:hypothetical protein DL95DRAFT_471058 [Leptodontidium sp. 2 PMI_412]|nr:hypothetical protein DL95DRAFT_471058 [Leptodontidium sp. 2 PMI_412]
MKGTIAFEEAILDPSYPQIHEKYAYVLKSIRPAAAATTTLFDRLVDIHDMRLKDMDAHGVEYMVLSLTAPGPQGELDVSSAESMATNANNYLAGEVSKNPQRFGAFAALSMHRPDQAAAELTRAVEKLGMLGGMINDYQAAGTEENEQKIYYDTPDYDPFWSVVESLDVPIYFHPRFPISRDLENVYGTRKHLIGAGVQFHLDLSWHIYALCSSGVLDRFPKLKIIAGHLGENIPFNLWRASHWYNKMEKKPSRPSIHDYLYYFRHNVYITTSGNFSTKGLKFCIGELGIERCLYSIDTPYDNISEAQEWWKTVDLPEDQKNAVARENAIRLLKLPLEL